MVVLGCACDVCEVGRALSRAVAWLRVGAGVSYCRYVVGARAIEFALHVLDFRGKKRLSCIGSTFCLQIRC